MNARITLVVAVARNGVIGREGDMPWHIRTDLKRFKALTWGRPMIMGRKTWEAIGRPLPGRDSVVVTRDETFSADGAHVVHSLEAGIEQARALAVSLGAEEIAVIGGGEIYLQAIELADCLHITEVEASPPGDAFFPALDPAVWMEETRSPHDAGEQDDHAFAFVTYVRRADADQS